MNSPRILFTLLAALAFGRVAHAEPFVRPAGSYYFLHTDGYSNTRGIGIAAGDILGDQGAHELSLEWDRATWSYLTQPPPDIFGGTVIYGSGTIQPVQFNYRYRFGDNHSRIRLYLGPSAGFTATQGHLTSSNGSAFYYTGSYRAWSFTCIGAAGVQVKILRNVCLDAGCQYVWIKGVDASLPSHSYIGETLSPLTLNLGDIKALVLHLGLQVSF
jgi:hypothetical protein